MELYALALWEETQEISVLPASDVRGEIKKKGAKWGNKFYPVKVVVQSGDEKWLGSLRVSVNGELILGEDATARSKELLAVRQAVRKEQNDLKKTQAASKKAYEEATLKSSSILDSVSRDDKLPDRDRNKKCDDNEVRPRCDNKSKRKADGDAKQTAGPKPKQKADHKVEQRDDEKTPEKAGSSKMYNSDKIPEVKQGAQMSCLCSKLPEVTSEDIDLLGKILNLARSMYAGGEADVVAPSIDKAKPAKGGFSKNEIVPLLEGSRILLPEWKIESIKTTNKKNPRGMVKKFMIEILGEDILIKSSPTGKGGRLPIPKDVFDDVEMYVKKNVKKTFKLSHDEYMKCLTAQCSTLRNKKKDSRSGTVKVEKIAEEGKEKSKKEDRKQKPSKIGKDDQLRKRAAGSKPQNECRKNLPSTKTQKDGGGESDSEEEKEGEHNIDSDSDGETGTSDFDDGMSGNEETSVAKQQLNRQSQSKKDDIESADTSKEENEMDSKVPQEPQLDQNERSGGNSTRKDQSPVLISVDGDATIMSGSKNGFSETTDSLNSSPRGNSKTVLSDQNAKSFSQNSATTSSPTSRKSLQEEDDEKDGRGKKEEGRREGRDTDSAFLKNPLQKEDDQKPENGLNLPCEGNKNDARTMKRPSDESQNDFEADDFEIRESAYLNEIRELKAKLLQKSAESIINNDLPKGSHQSERSTEVKKRKKNDAPKRTSKKSKK